MYLEKLNNVTAKLVLLKFQDIAEEHCWEDLESHFEELVSLYDDAFDDHIFNQQENTIHISLLPAGMSDWVGFKIERA